MAFPSDFRQAQPADQADGLRRLFSVRAVRFIPVVSNPFVAHPERILQRMTSALESLGLYTLLVDASEAGPVLREGAFVPLADRVQTRSDRVACLPAAGLSGRWSDRAGSRSGFLRALIEAAPLSQAVLLHAGAEELGRMLGNGSRGLSRPRPIVLCDERAESVRHAYSALKQLAANVGWREHDMLLSACLDAPATCDVSARMAHCADMFFGGVQNDCIEVVAGRPPSWRAAEALSSFMDRALQAGAAFVPSSSRPLRPGAAPRPISPSCLQPMV